MLKAPLLAPLLALCLFLLLARHAGSLLASPLATTLVLSVPLAFIHTLALYSSLGSVNATIAVHAVLTLALALIYLTALTVELVDSNGTT